MRSVLDLFKSRESHRDDALSRNALDVLSMKVTVRGHETQKRLTERKLEGLARQGVEGRDPRVMDQFRKVVSLDKQIAVLSSQIDRVLDQTSRIKQADMAIGRAENVYSARRATEVASGLVLDAQTESELIEENEEEQKELEGVVFGSSSVSDTNAGIERLIKQWDDKIDKRRVKDLELIAARSKLGAMNS